jgi:transposase
MKFITGKNRSQTEFFCLEEVVDANNEVRLIDAFIDSLNLAEFGFKTQFIENGRPAYHPSCLLKLFIYGYLNRTRSSRTLENECKRNLEVMWLMRSLVPDCCNYLADNISAMQDFRKSCLLGSATSC